MKPKRYRIFYLSLLFCLCAVITMANAQSGNNNKPDSNKQIAKGLKAPGLGDASAKKDASKSTKTNAQSFNNSKPDANKQTAKEQKSPGKGNASVKNDATKSANDTSKEDITSDSIYRDSLSLLRQKITSLNNELSAIRKENELNYSGEKNSAYIIYSIAGLYIIIVIGFILLWMQIKNKSYFRPEDPERTDETREPKVKAEKSKRRSVIEERPTEITDKHFSGRKDAINIEPDKKDDNSSSGRMDNKDPFNQYQDNESGKIYEPVEIGVKWIDKEIQGEPCFVKDETPAYFFITKKGRFWELHVLSEILNKQPSPEYERTLGKFFEFSFTRGQNKYVQARPAIVEWNNDLEEGFLKTKGTINK